MNVDIVDIYIFSYINYRRSFGFLAFVEIVKIVKVTNGNECFEIFYINIFPNQRLRHKRN